MRCFLFILLVLLFPLQSFGLFVGESISTGERSQAVFTNPAGLAVQPGKELWLALVLDSSSNLSMWSLSVALGNLGFGFRAEENDTLMALVSGFGMSGGFRLGYGVTWKNRRPSWQVGFLSRPFSCLSLGGVLSNLRKDRKPEYRLGLGLRPFTDRITLFADIASLAGEKIKDAQYTVGLGIEPYQGILFHTEYEKGNSLTAGVQISLGKLVLGSSRKENQLTSLEVLTTERPVRTRILEKDRVVELTLEGEYKEEREVSLFGRRKTSFYDIVKNLKEVGKDRTVKGLFVRWDHPALGFAQMEELRRTLEELKERGKKIVVFSESLGGLGYYGASSATKLLTIPSSALVIPGLRFEVMFFKGTMDKLGIQADLARVGKYKSAVEPFTREKMSEPYREQLSDLLDDLFDSYVKGIGKSRGIGRDSLLGLIDKGAFTTEDALEAGLIDTVLYSDDIDSLLSREYGKKVARIPIGRWEREKPYKVEWNGKGKPKIALIIAEGAITTGRSSSNPLTGKTMGSSTISKAIRKARKDKSIKAIVMRVNSPGGSGLASDIIWREVILAKREKPFIVSMGNVAASGGYYISTGADRIVAEKGTITGSIGVLAGKLVLRDFYQKIGINKEILKRGAHADIFSDWRPFNQDEKRRFQEFIEYFYWDFVEKVSKGRKMTTEEIHRIAQGRVWSGKRAKELGLLDTIGGLFTAIELAKEMAGIPKDKEVEIVLLPRKRGLLDWIRGTRDGIVPGIPFALRKAGEELSLLELFEKEAVIPLMPFRIRVD